MTTPQKVLYDDIWSRSVKALDEEEAKRTMKTELRDDDGCVIILHPNDDGTYHWMCPNCKREDLGLSAETDLTAYCPNVACPGCGFQFGVDKRYLNELSAPYICGECLFTQRFDGACGNCGANALRRASTPLPLSSSESLPKAGQLADEVELSDEQVTEIEARLQDVYAKWHSPDYVKRLLDTDIPALCQTVRTLREELECACEFCDETVYDKQGNPLTFLVCGRCWNASAVKNQEAITALRDEAATLTAENTALREQLQAKATLVISETAQENTRLREQLAEARAQVEKFSTLADERHDLLAAEKRANDGLRGQVVGLNTKLAQVEKELAATKQHRDDLIEELRRQP